MEITVCTRGPRLGSFLKLQLALDPRDSTTRRIGGSEVYRTLQSGLHTRTARDMPGSERPRHSKVKQGLTNDFRDAVTR